ncbi:MAG TPA: MOSC domain-containing protein [Nitrososphaerales archaeon]|nr:MOSC domain-containing protein [Nitrososphaerales archaeon]
MGGDMRLVSVNVGMPREIGKVRGRQVESAIHKSSVVGPVTVRRLNLEGDGQADLTVHGGEDKAVYAYPSEHYEYWRKRFPGKEMPWGMFGENLTTQGLMEGDVHTGDRLLIGSAKFFVTRPRLPCFKLGIKFGTNSMLKWFLESERTGFYLGVSKEGQIEAGDAISLVKTNQESDTIATIVRMAKKKSAKE